MQSEEGVCYWPQQITHSKISIILYIIRMLNPVIVLLFISKYHYFKNMPTSISVMIPLHLPVPGQITVINLCIN